MRSVKQKGFSVDEKKKKKESVSKKPRLGLLSTKGEQRSAGPERENTCDGLHSSIKKEKL